MDPWTFALVWLLISGAAIVVFAVVHDAWQRRGASIEPEPGRSPKTCGAWHEGRKCGLRGYFLDQHIDGKWGWYCPGCHDDGHRQGWLRRREVAS
jgi:hypothetical protein